MIEQGREVILVLVCMTLCSVEEEIEYSTYLDRIGIAHYGLAVGTLYDQGIRRRIINKINMPPPPCRSFSRQISMSIRAETNNMGYASYPWHGLSSPRKHQCAVQ
jgi:hypothetical protein